MKFLFITLAFASLAALRGVQAVDDSTRSYIVMHDETNHDGWVDAIGDIEITHRYEFIPGVAAVLTNDQVERLKATKGIEVHPDSTDFHLSTVEKSPPWGLDRINQRKLPLDKKYEYSEFKPVSNVYVMDTGILITHDEFDNNRATWGANFIDKTDTDCYGHGTHVAGIIGGKTYGVAKSATLIAVKIFDCEASTTLSAILKAIDWVIIHHKKSLHKRSVINMSFGGPVNSALDKAINSAISAGIHIVVAAGNEDSDACYTSPAHVHRAITVGASDRTDNRAEFSNFGKCLDLFAPGVNVLSSYIPDNNSTVVFSGTSMATPHVVGAVALLLQEAHWNTTALSKHIIDTATNGTITNSLSHSLLLFVNSTL